MKRLKLFVIFLAAGLIVCTSAFAQNNSSKDLGYINVKDFGAKGDNKADDTKAIQAAFDALAKHNTGGKSISGTNYVGSAEVIFPAGTYRISETIKIGGAIIRGLGYAAIQQTDNEKDIFYSRGAWRMTIEGLTFLDGKNQLHIGNPNIDQGLLIIKNCKFVKSRDCAIRIIEKTASTHLVVKECNFSRCEQTLINWCDQAILRDSWITTEFMRDKAVIENRSGFLSISDILAVPLVTGADQRWVDNYSSLSMRAFRFGGEFGGFCGVVNYAKFSKEAGGPRVFVEDSWVSANSNKKRLCAVYLEEMPNSLVVRDNILAGVPAVIAAEKLEDKKYYAGARPGVFHIDISSNSGEFGDELPTKMLKAIEKRRKTPDPIPGQLSRKETESALKKAVSAVMAFKEEPAAPGEFRGHKQKTNPDDYVEFTFEDAHWDPHDLMDATTVKNSEYIAVAPADDDIVLMRRAAGKWPHVLVRDITIDLDTTPFITWKQKDIGAGTPAGYAVKMIHNESQKMILLTERHWPPFFDYNAYDLRKEFDLAGGVHTFSIRFYVLAIHVKQLSSSTAKPGEFLVLDFIRAEKE